MKTYIIINSDIMHQGKIFPEGSTISLDDKDSVSLSDYLRECHSVLDAESKLSLVQSEQSPLSQKQSKNKGTKK